MTDFSKIVFKLKLGIDGVRCVREENPKSYNLIC